jgi:mRNA interferase MazF
MKPGTVVLAQLQQSDGLLKTRPVVVLASMPPFGDLLVCAVSSKLKHECREFDDIVKPDDGDFRESGLKVVSLIRLGMVATIPATVVLGALGSISGDRLDRLRFRLARMIEGEQGTTGSSVLQGEHP